MYYSEHFTAKVSLNPCRNLGGTYSYYHFAVKETEAYGGLIAPGLCAHSQLFPPSVVFATSDSLLIDAFFQCPLL